MTRMPAVPRIIHQRHRAMASVLFALRALTRQALRSGNRPDFRWLRMLAEYVERFPGRLHHPNEETYLYRVLLRRGSPRRPAWSRGFGAIMPPARATRTACVPR